MEPAGLRRPAQTWPEGEAKKVSGLGNSFATNGVLGRLQPARLIVERHGPKHSQESQSV